MILPAYVSVFFFNDTATTEIYTLSLHDALPIFRSASRRGESRDARAEPRAHVRIPVARREYEHVLVVRSEEHTSELQSRLHLVCRLLPEKNKSATCPRPSCSCRSSACDGCNPLR